MRAVAEKMGLKADSRAYFVNAPDTAPAAMALPNLDCPSLLVGAFDHIHVFASNASDLDREFAELKGHVARTGRLWVSWPKGGRNGTDLNIREVIRIGYSHGMVESTALSVDQTWSALKFTHPKPNKRYNNSYGKLPDG
ncbi:hypothetical protein [Tabrizicola sp.]|uniref:hypothetical protein n=1 Tax=Tabrizicola sp. TaxID=2005166 RepID=UPI003F38188A